MLNLPYRQRYIPRRHSVDAAIAAKRRDRILITIPPGSVSVVCPCKCLAVAPTKASHPRQISRLGNTEGSEGILVPGRHLEHVALTASQIRNDHGLGRAEDRKLVGAFHRLVVGIHSREVDDVAGDVIGSGGWGRGGGVPPEQLHGTAVDYLEGDDLGTSWHTCRHHTGRATPEVSSQHSNNYLGIQDSRFEITLLSHSRN